MRLKKISENDLAMKYSQKNLFYLQKSRWKSININLFSILNYDVYLTPDEIFQPFVEISNYLTMNRDAYLKLLERM